MMRRGCLEDEVEQRRTLHLRRDERRHDARVSQERLRVQAQTHAGSDAAGAASALRGGRARASAHEQRVRVRAHVEVRQLLEANVDDDADVCDRNRRLGDIRREDDFDAPGGWLAQRRLLRFGLLERVEHNQLDRRVWLAERAALDRLQALLSRRSAGWIAGIAIDT